MALTSTASLESGDLIFVSLDCGSTCQAIESVTLKQFQVTAPSLSHLGLIEKSNSEIWVWEAWPGPGVQRIPLKDFLDRPIQAPNTRVLKIQDEIKAHLPKLFEQLRTWQTKAYDPIFAWTDSSFYCSELIFKAWREVAPELQLFSEAVLPMDFGSPLSSERLVWKQYFDRWYLNIPAGRPGISPLGIYLSAKKSPYFQSKPSLANHPN